MDFHRFFIMASSQFFSTRKTRKPPAKPVAVKDGRDARVVRYSLTERAKPIAAEHEHHHAHTIASYEELLSEFSDQEKATIDRFLEGLVERISQ